MKHKRALPPHLAAAVEAARKKLGIHVPERKPARREHLNQTERAYLQLLERRRAQGEIAWIGAHESLAFQIADAGTGKRAVYRPDFPVLLSSGELQLHEVKGFWREAARLRIKCAATQYPFLFLAATIEDGDWCFEEFRGAMARS